MTGPGLPLATGEGTGSALGQKASEMRARAEAWLAGQWRRDETASIAAATDFARDVVGLLKEVEELRAGTSLADNLADNLARVQKHLQFKAAECGRLREQVRILETRVDGFREVAKQQADKRASEVRRLREQLDAARQALDGLPLWKLDDYEDAEAVSRARAALGRGVVDDG